MRKETVGNKVELESLKCWLKRADEISIEGYR